MRNPIRFFNLSAQKKMLLLEAMTGFTIVKVLSLILPFHYLAKLIGKPGEFCSEIAVLPPPVLLDLKWAVQTAEKLIPWGKKCLIQAITAKLMARHHGYSTTFFLGVRRDRERGLVYHAWLRYHDFPITGGKTDGVYHKLNSFH
jgi:hypothetical protein